MNDETTADSDEIRTIIVSNVQEFVAALGSDRIIELQPGKYNLSERVDNSFEGEDDSPDGVSWSYGDGSIRLTGFSNLTIRGAKGGKNGKLPGLVIDERYAYVLTFVDCSDIVIDGISAGHSEGGYCTGGVFAFENSSGITINEAAMYGSGTEGLTLTNVSYVKVANSRIYECTYSIMTVANSKNIAFENCTFDNNREFDLVNVGNTRNMSFADCKFKDNEGGKLFSVENNATVSVSNSVFSGNIANELIVKSPNVSFSNCEFDNKEVERAALRDAAAAAARQAAEEELRQQAAAGNN